MFKNVLLLLVVTIISCLSPLFSQNLDTTNNNGIKPKNKLTLSGYGELYYSVNINPNFSGSVKDDYSAVNHTTLYDLDFNIFFIKANYVTHNFRSNLAIGDGTYMRKNYINEDPVVNKIMEANFGVKLLKKHNVWLDAGVMPSHIGFESAIGNESWNATRSMTAEISPYFETGLKLSYVSKKENLNVALFGLTGWQNIIRYDYKYRLPSFGLQVKYNFSQNLFLNYSNYFGPSDDNIDKLKSYNNLYAQWENKKKKIGIQAGFDVGTDQPSFGTHYSWYSMVLASKFKINKNIDLSLRYDNYILDNSKTNREIHSFTLNADFRLYKNLLWRLESRFYTNDNYFKAKDDLFLSSMLCVSF